MSLQFVIDRRLPQAPNLSNVSCQKVVLLCLWVLSFSSFATELPVIQFSVKPSLCVLSDGEKRCHDELEVQWMSKTLRSLCLFQKDKRLPLRCWEDQYSGKHQFVINASKDINFQLKEMYGGSLLVTQAFEVLQDQPQYRRRRRNPWSFF